jgi:hypothetical protein
MFQTYKSLFLTIYRSKHEYQFLKVTESDLLDLLDKIEVYKSTHGDKQTIKYIKALRTSIYKSIAGEPIEVKWLKTDKNRGNLPRVFGVSLRNSIYSKELEGTRLILTLLQISYLITLPLTPDTQSITSESHIDLNLIEEISLWFSQNVKDVIPLTDEFSDWASPHRSTSAGPLGPAMWTAPNELDLLQEPLISQLKVLGGPYFAEWFTRCINIKSSLQNVMTIVETRMKYSPTKLRKTHSLRRLCAISAPEGKTRVIAIMDYWSQTVLKNLHDWSFDILRRIPQDMTFNQGYVLNVIANKPCYYSYDLSSATDRFPIILQERILSCLIGSERANAWAKILVGQPFQADWGGTYNYKVGQPMGAYSSWSIFAISHHVIVKFAAHKVGLTTPFTDYAILGDDLVIAHDKVAQQYRTIINQLGVDISDAKSLVSNDTFEFAKRVFHKEKEFTAFPLSSVYENLRSPSALWSSLLTARERGYAIFPQCVPGLVAKLQAKGGKGKRLTYSEAKDLEAIRCLAQDDISSDEFVWGLLHIYKSLRIPIPCNKQIHQLKDELAAKMVTWTTAYYRELLQSTMREYQVLSDKILAHGVEEIINLLPPDFVDTDDESALPLDPAKIPLTWVLIKEIENWERDITRLSPVSKRPVLSFLKDFQVTPAADLRRVISRRVNKKNTARSSSYIRFLRNKSKVVEKKLMDELMSTS